MQQPHHPHHDAQNDSAPYPTKVVKMFPLVFISTSVIIGALGALIAPGEEHSLVASLIVLAVGAGAATAAMTVGSKYAPVEAGRTLTDREAVQAFHTPLMLRCALGEVAVIASLVVTMVVPSNWLTPVLGMVISVAVLAVSALPNQQTFRRAEAALDREGGRSRITEVFEGSDRQGPI